MISLRSCFAALFLCGCAASPARTTVPADFRVAVQSIAGSKADACGTIEMKNDAERLAGYQCVRDALTQHRAFWLASLSGMSMAWAGNTEGKVWQLMLIGGKVSGGECRQFAVTTEKGLHCSL